jgi:hypothetical protein
LPIAYGEEEEWLALSELGTEVDHLLVLFSLASTPEAENHGALVTGIGEALARSGGGTALTVMVDESTFRERMAGQSGAVGRVDARRTAWERMFAATAVPPFFADLASEDATVIRRLEAAMVRAPTLMPSKAARR